MKNLIKSLFISFLPTYALAILFLTVFRTKFNINDIGVLISSLSIVLFFLMLFIKPVARTSRFLIFYSLLIIVGVILNLIHIEKKMLIIVSTLAAGWVLYLTWYSSFKNRKKISLKIGNTLPHLILQTGNKKEINTSSFKGDFKIYLFYRGNWCPLCMAQIKEVVQQYKELTERNVDMILVSSQPHEFTKRLAKKYQVPFHFLVDTNNKVATQLGLLHKNGLPAGFQLLGYKSDVVLPTVIITTRTNKIIFADLTDNYRVRPEPETFLKIIDSYIKQ